MPVRVMIVLGALSCLTGCTPLVVGAAAAIGADAIAEDRQGGDGLF